MDAIWNEVDNEISQLYESGISKAIGNLGTGSTSSGDEIWYRNIGAFLDTRKFLEIWPTNNMSVEERINSTTRFILISCIIIAIAFKKSKYIIFGLVLVGMLAFVYHENVTKQHPDLKALHA